jgi:hypothetical protein
MAKTPGINFVFSVSRQSLHHVTIAHGIESRSIFQVNVVFD